MFSLTIARLAAVLRPKWRVGQAGSLRRSDTPPTPGISVVIPSRNGRALLETCPPTIAPDFDRAAAQREAARLAEFQAKTAVGTSASNPASGSPTATPSPPPSPCRRCRCGTGPRLP